MQAITYAITYQPVAYLAAAETPTTKLRSKTSGVAYFFQQCGGLIVTFAAPYMQDAGYGNMGPYIGFFFGGISFLGLLFVYFFYPELKGLSIEQMDVLFEQRLPTKQFRKVLRGVEVAHVLVVEGKAADGIENDEIPADGKSAEATVKSI